MLQAITKRAVCAMVPCLDKDFVPAVLWDREFRKAVKASGKSRKIIIAVERTPESVSTFETVVFADPTEEERAANIRHVERLVKGMLWMRGGWKITIAGDAVVAADLAKIYSSSGERAFDYEMMSRIYSNTMRIDSCAYEAAPKAVEPTKPLGRHLEGCRIGFDLGGSDRKCAAL
ncbi:MAG: ROK family protein, partial [Lentisphaeria bacterium]|nr:ROK family protein [Lentisphaeria bacterium]